MVYIGVVIEGVEDIAAQEVNGTVKGRGRILFEKEKKEYQTIDTVYNLEDEFAFGTREDIVNALKKKRWCIQEPFRVTCKRIGQHLFTANDIEKEIGALIHEQGYAVNLKNPKTTVYVDIQEKLCAVGKLVQDNIEKRVYRVRRNSAGISASLAAAMIKKAGITPKESMLDPLCKDGVIAIEAAREGVKQVSATDTLENNVRNAKINAKMAKVNLNWEPEEDMKVDYIITNLWVPARMERAKQFAVNYLEKYNAKVRKKIVIITNWAGIERKIPEGCKIEEKILVKRGDIKNYIFVLSKKSG